MFSPDECVSFWDWIILYHFQYEITINSQKIIFHLYWGCQWLWTALYLEYILRLLLWRVFFTLDAGKRKSVLLRVATVGFCVDRVRGIVKENIRRLLKHGNDHQRAKEVGSVCSSAVRLDSHLGVAVRSGYNASLPRHHRCHSFILQWSRHSGLFSRPGQHAQSGLRGRAHQINPLITKAAARVSGLANFSFKVTVKLNHWQFSSFLFYRRKTRSLCQSLRRH